MSFFSDLFEGNFGNLGTDLSHTFSSLAAHPDELAETIGVGGLIAAPFLLPELGAAFGIGGALGGAELGADAALAGTTGALADEAFALAPEVAAGDFLGGAGGLSGVLDTAAGEVGAGGAFDLGSIVPEFASSPEFAPYLTDTGALADTATGLAENTGTFSDIINAQPGSFVDQSGAATAQVNAAEVAGGPSTAPAADPGALPANATISDVGGAGGGIPSYSAGGGGGGVTGALGDALKSPWTRLALGAAPLALTLGMGEAQLPASAQALQGQAAALQAQGLTDLSNANKGILNPGQTAVLSGVKNDLTNKWLQTLYNQGVQDPTKDARWPQIQAVIDAEVTKQSAALIQQNITNALQETGQASTALISIAQMQMNADTNFTNSLIGATKALGLAAAGRSGQTVTVST
jgi:hypothetical protein